MRPNVKRILGATYVFCTNFVTDFKNILNDKGLFYGKNRTHRHRRSQH